MFKVVRNFSSIPQVPVKGPYPYENCSFLPLYFDSQMENLTIKNVLKGYKKYHSKNTLINPWLCTKTDNFVLNLFNL